MREEAAMSTDGQGGTVGSDEFADEVWEDESPAAVEGEPSEGDAGDAPGQP